MDALARQEYPAMLASLTPTQAATLFNERVKRIDKVNNEVADWIQERRKVEELYAQSLRKLAAKQLPGNKSELGIFTTPWAKIVSGTEQLAHSHSQFAQRIEADVEHALRTFSSKNIEMASIANIQGNLTSLAKEVESAQEASDKLAKKGGRASASRVEAATSKLEIKRTDWDSQAPFIFEKLQGLDESRLNHLRDVLTQLGTHETDMVERNRSTVEGTLNSLLEIDTAVEIHNFAANATGGKPRRPAPRQGSSVSQSARSVMSNHSSQLAPPTPTMQRPSVEDSASQHSGRNELSSQGSDKKESGLKRFGTMLKGRRQSIHAGAFGGGSFGRSKEGDFSALGPPPASRDGNRPMPSPRASSGNLREPSRGNSTLGAVEEQPASEASEPHDLVNGHDGADSHRPLHSDSQPGPRGVKTPPGPPPPRKHGSHHEFHAPPPRQDSEGFSVPPPRDDPMAQALAEAADENDSAPAFKLNIKPEAIQEEGDAEAALSTVADKLSSALQPQRSVGTVRGRREVRNTMYIPAADHPGGMGGPPEPPRSAEAPASLANNQSFGSNQPSAPASMANSQSFSSAQASPSMPTGQSFHSTTFTAAGGKNAALAALQGQSNERVGSSSDSIRSAGSSANRSGAKHPEMKEPGFNAAIVETVHALFKNGELTDLNVHGDIAVQFNPADGEKHGADEIRIKSIDPVGTLVPNAAFVHTKEPSTSTEWNTLSHSNDNPKDQNYILTLPNSCIPLSAFKYKLMPGADAKQQYLPLMMEIESKNVGEDATGVVFNYFINPSCRHQGDEIKLDKLTFLLRYSGEVNTCQSKPASRHVKERKCLYFTLGDITVKKGEKYKAIARLGGRGGERPKVDVIEAAFEAAWFSDFSGLMLERMLVKREADPFGDTEEMVETTSWEPMDIRRKVVGKEDFSLGDKGEKDTIEERPLSPHVGA